MGEVVKAEKKVVWESPPDIVKGRVYVIVSLKEEKVLAAISSPQKRVIIRDPWEREVVIVLTVWGRTLNVVANWTPYRDLEAMLRADKIMRRQPCVKIL